MSRRVTDELEGIYSPPRAARSSGRRMPRVLQSALRLLNQLRPDISDLKSAREALTQDPVISAIFKALLDHIGAADGTDFPTNEGPTKLHGVQEIGLPPIIKLGEQVLERLSGKIIENGVKDMGADVSGLPHFTVDLFHNLPPVTPAPDHPSLSPSLGGIDLNKDEQELAYWNKVVNDALSKDRSPPAPGVGPVPQEAIDEVGAKPKQGSGDDGGGGGNEGDKPKGRPESTSPESIALAADLLLPFTKPGEIDNPADRDNPDWTANDNFGSERVIPREIEPYLRIHGTGPSSDDPEAIYGGGGLPGGIRDPRQPLRLDPEGQRVTDGRHRRPGVRPPGGPAGTPNWEDGGGPSGPAARFNQNQRLLVQVLSLLMAREKLR